MYPLSDHISNPIGPEQILSFCHQSIPSKRFVELKKGKIVREARLDLHGLQVEDAREALCAFLDEQLCAQNRCFLLIHGKGGQHSDYPILKNLVNQWLRQLPMVCAFHSAQPRDGGTGALYVLLKRQRGL